MREYEVRMEASTGHVGSTRVMTEIIEAKSEDEAREMAYDTMFDVELFTADWYIDSEDGEGDREFIYFTISTGYAGCRASWDCEYDGESEVDIDRMFHDWLSGYIYIDVEEVDDEEEE